MKKTNIGKSKAEKRLSWTYKGMKFYADEYKIDGSRTRELAANMSKLIEKWNRLVGDIETADQLAKLYWNEVYSKLDPATYGR